jgi:GNS1/SUR4 family
MKHPIQIVGVIGVYLMFTLKWGPKYMENRKAYDLKLIMMVYNLLQVAVNTWLFFYVSELTMKN